MSRMLLLFSWLVLFPLFSFANDENNSELIHYFFFQDLPNNEPLTTISAHFSQTGGARIDFTSALTGYPFNSEHPFWRKASMERRGEPTELNYRPEGNNGVAFSNAGNIRAMQVKQPFTQGENENILVFSVPTSGFEQVVFSFAAMDEDAGAQNLRIDYSVSATEAEWIITGLDASQTSLPLLTDQYQLYTIDFSNIEEANDNPDFKIRIRFDVSEGQADDGDRVTFNNMALDGVPMETDDENGENVFIFTNDVRTYQQNFATYRGSAESIPEFFMVAWDVNQVANPFTGVGDFATSNPDDSYGGFVAYTADNENFSFGIRERAPVDLRDSRLFFSFRNDTDEPISVLNISYDVEAWFIGDRRNRIRLKFDTVLASDDRNVFETDIFSTDNPSSETTVGAIVNGSLPAHRTTVSGQVDITTLDDGSGNNFAPLAPGQTAYFRWQYSNADGDGGALRSGLAITNVQISLSDEPSSAKEITSFVFASLDPAVNGFIDQDNNTISASVPFGTDVTALAPTIVFTGQSVSPNSGVAQDFSNPVTYTVTAEDGSEVAYVVTVTVEDEVVDPDPGVFTFTNERRNFSENFNTYAGSMASLPAYFMVTWDESRTDNPFTGVGNFASANPSSGYGGFVAYTADNESFSFGIRERAPVDLRDARLYFSFRNDTDQPISVFTVSYDVEAWFIGDRRNRIRLKYDNVLTSDDRSVFETDIFSTDNPSSETTAGAIVNGSLPAHRTTVSGQVDITTLDDGSGNNFAPLAPGETAYFRWQFSNADGDDGALRSGLALTNVQISALDPTHSEYAAALPAEVTLNQNFPNPFNPTTQITYHVPVQSDVTLHVYTVHGQRIATLVNSKQPAGTHQVTFDASQLASGVYLYRLQAGSVTQTRRMTVIK